MIDPGLRADNTIEGITRNSITEVRKLALVITENAAARIGKTTNRLKMKSFSCFIYLSVAKSRGGGT